METCPTCSQEAPVLITNIRTGQQFCHRCAGTACPTFMPGLVYTLEDVKFLRECGIDPEVGKIEDYLEDLTEHCKRSSGTERAWFRTREEAEAFANDPANTVYHGDLAHLCSKCGFYHLSKPGWLEPSFSIQDLNFLSECGSKDSAIFRCAACRKEFQENVEFLILRDGTITHEQCIP
jgi:hypothetical protein